MMLNTTANRYEVLKEQDKKAREAEELAFSEQFRADITMWLQGEHRGKIPLVATSMSDYKIKFDVSKFNREFNENLYVAGSAKANCYIDHSIGKVNCHIDHSTGELSFTDTQFLKCKGVKYNRPGLKDKTSAFNKFLESVGVNDGASPANMSVLRLIHFAVTVMVSEKINNGRQVGE